MRNTFLGLCCGIVSVALSRRTARQAFSPTAKTLPKGQFTCPEEVKERGPRPAEPGGATDRSEGEGHSNISCETPFWDYAAASCLSPFRAERRVKRFRRQRKPCRRGNSLAPRK